MKTKLRSKLLIAVACTLTIFACEQQGEDPTDDLSNGELITVPLNLSGITVEVSDPAGGRVSAHPELDNPFTLVLILNKDNETRGLEKFYAAGVYEGVPENISLDLVKGNLYEITAKVMAASETSQGLARFEDAQGQLQLVPSHKHPFDQNNRVYVTNEMRYGNSEVNAMGVNDEYQFYVSGFAQYLDENGNLVKGDHDPQLEVFYGTGDVSVTANEPIQMMLERQAFALRFESEKELESEYRASLFYLYNDEERSYLQIGPGNTKDRRVATFYQHPSISWQFGLKIEQKFNSEWIEVYYEAQQIRVNQERLIRINENPSGQNNGNLLSFSFLDRPLQQGDPIDLDIKNCTGEFNRILHITAQNTAINAPLAGHEIEVWVKDDFGDMFVGHGLTDNGGNIFFEVTRNMMDRVFTSSQMINRIYYKVFFDGQLLSNSRDTSSPGYDPNISIRIPKIMSTEECAGNCPTGPNQLISVKVETRPGNDPLAGHFIEMWDIENNGDRLVGFGNTNDFGFASFEVTGPNFDKIFVDSSPSIYYKIFLNGELLSNSRDINSPTYDPAISSSVTDTRELERCN